MSKPPVKNYTHILAGLKEKIRSVRMKAMLSVNRDMLFVYWEIGRVILEQQQEEGWGAKVIDTLAADLKTEFPDFKGLSARNLKYMRTFAEAYPEFGIGQGTLAQLKDGMEPIVQQPVAQLQHVENQSSIIGQQFVAQLPWGHHVVILDKVKTKEHRVFYIQKALTNGWSRNILSAQIESKLHERDGKAITNFNNTLPAHDSDLAIETFKNPYIFDFITLSEEAKEKDLERALIQHLKKFMLELGKGFAYVGNQYNLNVKGDDFFLDLLFYNTHLHCYVIFELKIGEFKPEFAGKLNFYINTVNEQIRGKEDKPTIGVLLCRTPNETVVKYSLTGIDQPMGVADYKLAKALPKNIKSEMPTVEELEKEMEEEVERLENPLDKKQNRLKELLKNLKEPKVKEVRDDETSRKIFLKLVIPLRNTLKDVMAGTIRKFKKVEFVVGMDGRGFHSDKDAKAHFEEYRSFNHFRIDVRMEGFIAAGTKAFDVSKDLYITTDRFNYSIGFEQYAHKGTIIPEKLYHELPTREELGTVVSAFHEKILDEIIQQVERITAEKIKK